MMAALGSGSIPAPARAAGDRPETKPPAVLTSDRYAAIMAEFEAASARFRLALDKVETQAEANKIARERAPDELAFSRRMNELAATDPANPTARDALV